MTGFSAGVELDATYHMHTYARKPARFVRGMGVRLFDEDGREYLDFVSGIGAVSVGHADTAVAEAVSRQMQLLVHVSNLFYVEGRAELAATLVEMTGWPVEGDGPAARVFFCNSGTEASEGAIKLARRWAAANKPGAFRIVTAEGSFHGRTLAALAATAQASKQDAFRPLPEGFDHVPLNDLEALEAAITSETCAVFLEPIQGEGGVWPCDPEYLHAVRRLCDERNVLLMLDEVQTGFYRTGTAFAHQGYGVTPDVMTLAKGIANGLPMGAIVARTSVADCFIPGDHGSTFGGGPVLCAAALATIDRLRAKGLGANAVTVGAHLRDALTALARQTGRITEVRGTGLMVGISLSEPVAAAVTARALDRGVVLNNVGDSIIRFLPPLVCTVSDVDAMMVVLSETLEEVWPT